MDKPHLRKNHSGPSKGGYGRSSLSTATGSIEGQYALSLALFFQTERVTDPQITEAKWLAHSVMELDRRIDERETIGILLFARTRISLYLQAFRDIGYPVMVTEGLLLTDKIEVLSMHQMLNALITTAR